MARNNQAPRQVAQEGVKLREIWDRHSKAVTSISLDAGFTLENELHIWKTAALQAHADRGTLIKLLDERAKRRNKALDRTGDIVGQAVGVVQGLVDLLVKQELEALEDLPADARDSVRALAYSEAADALDTACQAMVDGGASIGRAS